MDKDKLGQIADLEADLAYLIKPDMTLEQKIQRLSNSYWRAHNFGYGEAMAGRMMSGREDDETEQFDWDCKHKYEVEDLLTLLHELRDEQQ